MANLFDRDDIAIGIALPFGSGQSNFKLNYTTLDQARTNVINLLLTHKGERFMQPEFGTNLRRFLFRQNTRNLADDIQEDLLSAIKRWLPYIKTETINVERSVQNIEEYTVHVTITFSVIQDISKFTTVTFNFNSSGGVTVGGNN
jgi:phage baseplate assembly protein W